MKITLLLVKRLNELGLDAKHLNVATRNDDEVRSFLLTKMVAGAISDKDVASLSSQEDESAAQDLITKAIATANKETEARFDAITKSMTAMSEALVKLSGVAVPSNDQGKQAPATDVGIAGKMLGGAGVCGDGANTDGTKAPRVKCVSELYNKSCQTLTYDMSSNANVRKSLSGPVMAPAGVGQRELQTQSDFAKAISGAWFKFMVNRQCKAQGRAPLRCFKMSEHDEQLVRYAVENSNFVGPVGHTDEESDQADMWLSGKRITSELHKKALLDDTTSGGLEAVPIEFDNAIITQAILTGELFPFITVQTTSRRRIEGASVGNVTFSSTAEGTAVSPFNTASFVAAFDTTIYPIVGTMEMGLDFMDDSPANMGAIVGERYATGFANKLDVLVAEGSGTDEMLGLMNTTGLTSVSSASGTGGPQTVSDWEGLLFGVPKAYRQEAGKTRSVFVSNDTTYRRLRGIPVGASDQRRVYGMDHESYMTHDHPHKISETTTNSRAGFFCLNRYRAYRRQGYTVRIETGGETLTRKNMQLIYVRARFGGQLENGAAGSRVTDLQS